MRLCPQGLNFFLQVILCSIITVANQKASGSSSVLHVNIPDRSEGGQLTVYPETTRLCGTAYAANLGSDKYSSDFGWSAEKGKQGKKKDEYIRFRNYISHTSFCRKTPKSHMIKTAMLGTIHIYTIQNVAQVDVATLYLSPLSYLAMDRYMSKHACLLPTCKNMGWFCIEEATWNADPMPHTIHYFHVQHQNDPQLQYQISKIWLKNEILNFLTFYVPITCQYAKNMPYINKTFLQKIPSYYARIYGEDLIV